MENYEKNSVREKCLLQAVDKLGQGSKLMWIIVTINLFTLLLFGLNSILYIFIAEVPKFRCSIAELSKANWTVDQINKILPDDSCQQYNYNYTHLAALGYDKAIKFVKDSQFSPNTISCTSFIFEDCRRSTIVNEWQLICDKKVYRTYTFLCYSLGIVLGASIIGMCADKYGRKTTLMIGIILQIISGPASALVPWLWSFLLTRFLSGISTSAMFLSSYTILSEIVKKDRRKVLVAALGSMLSLGTFCVICMSYILPNWRELQLGISCFLIPIISLVWLIPESPRWLISQGDYDKAQNIIERYDRSFIEPPIHSIENPTFKFSVPSKSPVTVKQNDNFLYRTFESLIILFTNSELRRKILIMCFTFYVTMAVDYILIFSIDNFNSDRYIYLSIAAINGILANMTILVVMIVLNSRESLIIVYILASFFMITITIIPAKDKNIIIGLALAAKFCISATVTANLVWNAESFPSNSKSTALGTCMIMGQIGSITALFIVNLFEKFALWAPTTIGSVLALTAGLLCFIFQTKFNDTSKSSVDKE